MTGQDLDLGFNTLGIGLFMLTNNGIDVYVLNKKMYRKLIWKNFYFIQQTMKQQNPKTAADWK